MNLMFLEIMHHQGPVCIEFTEFSRGRSLLKDEFRQGRPKSVVVSENIDYVPELSLQDRHVIFGY